MPNSSPEIFLSAGEVSGDRLASELVQQLNTQGSYTFYGVTGSFMRSAGVETLVPQEQLRVMGLAQVFFKAIQIHQIEQRLISQLQKRRPALVVLVDFPGLHFRIAKACKDLNIPVFQYVSPKVWAWGKKRVRNLERDFDKVLGILPFEKDFFQKTKVPYTFVGSPHLQRIKDSLDGIDSANSIEQPPTLTVLLGSRKDEIRRMLPIVKEVLESIRCNLPNLKVLVPVAAEEFEDMVQTELKDTSQIQLLKGESLKAMGQSQAALVNSGTATLECGLVGTPMAVCYQMDSFSYWVASKLIHLKWASLVNIILNKEAVPEFIQHISTKDLSATLLTLLDTKSLAHKNQKKHLQQLQHLLQIPPSGDASTVITQFLQRPTS